MKKKNLFKLLVLFMVFLPSSQSGEVFLEPYSGYFMGQLEQNRRILDVSSKSVGESKGFIYGGRLGVILNYTFGAFDYAQHKGNFETSTSALTDTYDAKGVMMSIVAGLKFDLMRLWGGFIFDTVYKITYPTNCNEYSGKGYRLGAGIFLFYDISLNLEYMVIEYNKLSIDGSEVNLPYSALNGRNYIEPLKHDLFFLSLSIPFEVSKI